ncbi:hypothetical protein KHP62_18345 [Rhodobacteraceae bacterium NNCM2]|nr:hypothetical protein [Coraliihabitans acroporae]
MSSVLVELSRAATRREHARSRASIRGALFSRRSSEAQPRRPLASAKGLRPSFPLPRGGWIVFSAGLVIGELIAIAVAIS